MGHNWRLEPTGADSPTSLQRRVAASR